LTSSIVLPFLIHYLSKKTRNQLEKHSMLSLPGKMMAHSVSPSLIKSFIWMEGG